MRIVFLSTAAQGGGAETVLLDLLITLRTIRPIWSLHLLAGEDGPLLEKAKRFGVTAEVLALPEPLRQAGDANAPKAMATRLISWAAAAIAALRYLRLLRKRLRTLAPDVLHSNGMKMHLLSSLAKPEDTPLVWHLHDYLGPRRLMKPLLRSLANRCQWVVAVSESVAADARLTLGSRVPVKTIYNGIDVQTFCAKGDTLNLDTLAGLPPSSVSLVRIGLIATFAFWKGHQTFLRTVARLCDATSTDAGFRGLPPLRFYIVGGPIYASPGSQHSLLKLRTLAQSLQVEEHVGFTEFVEDVPAALRALDIVIHASTQPEPFGLVIVQAMACSCAVILSEAGGAAELAAIGENALSHQPGDASQLAHSIAHLARDSAFRSRLGSAARIHVESRFTREQMTSGFVRLYEELAA